MSSMHTTIAGLSFDSFGMARIGLEKCTDPVELADRLEEMLAWIAIAGQYNEENQPKGRITSESMKRMILPWTIRRSYPVLSDLDGPLVSLVKSAHDNHGLRGLRSVYDKLGEMDVALDLGSEVDDKVIGGPLSCSTFSPFYIGDSSVKEGCEWWSIRSVVGEEKKLMESGMKQFFPMNLFHLHHIACEMNSSDPFFTSNIFLYGPRRNLRWPSAKAFPLPKSEMPKLLEALQTKIDNAYGLSLKRRYEWEVEFSLNKDMPGIVVSSDARGVREMLSTRDKAPSGRRAALMHWVKEHYRRKVKPSSDSTDLAFVRSHMRGQIECEYGGMHCRIYPSRYDLNRAINGDKIEARIERVTPV